MKQLTRNCLDFCWSLFGTRSFRERIARHLLDHSRGEGNDTPTANGEKWFASRVLEISTSAAPIVLDVGANIGAWTFMVANCTAKPVVFHAFEPSPLTFAYLREQFVKYSGSATLHPHNFALSDKGGKDYLRTFTEFAGSNSIHLRRFQATTDKIESGVEISLVTGDNFLQQHGLSAIDLVKIDTEGHEINVLRGFLQSIELRQIACIQFEYGGTWLDSRSYLHEAFDLLNPHGYVVARLHHRGIQVFSAYSQDLEDFRYANFLAIRADLLPFFDQVL